MRVVVTRIEWDGTMQRRLVDTANLKWDTDVTITPVPIPGKYKLA